MRELAERYPESNRERRRRGAAVLARAARAAADVPAGAGRAPGPDAGAAAGGVRQHRHAAAGAIGVAAARARRPPRRSARRRGGWPGCCSPRRWSSVSARVLGALLAAWGVQALRAVPLTTALPIRFQTSVDGVGLAVALGLGVASALLVAVCRRCRRSGSTSRRASRPARGRRRASWWRSPAMAAEVGLAMAVLIVAGLFLGRFADTRETDPGFERQGVLLAAYDRSARRVATTTRRRVLFVESRARRGCASAARRRGRRGRPPRCRSTSTVCRSASFVLEGRPRTDGVVDRRRPTSSRPATSP